MDAILKDRSGRALKIDADNEACPDSVFLMGERGFCMEFDRESFRTAMKLALGMYEPIEVGLERWLTQAA